MKCLVLSILNGLIIEIINLGEHWNEAGMIENKQEILSCNKGVGDYFRSAYRYLAAAKEIQDDIDIMVNEAVDRSKFNKLLLNLKGELMDSIEIKENSGSIRHLFDSSITPDGVVDYIETIVTDNHKCYYIKGDYSMGYTEIMSKFAEAYSIRGYNVELYHQPLNPDRLQTLVVDKLGIGITVNPKLESKANKVIDLNDTIIANKLQKNHETIEDDKDMMKNLLNEAISRIAKAKKLHDKMETYYISNMNFDEIDKVKEKTIDRIKRMIEKI